MKKTCCQLGVEQKNQKTDLIKKTKKQLTEKTD
jgi:hypothetical protein